MFLSLDETKQMDLNELLIKHPVATFFLRVQQDILIVDRSLSPKLGKLAIVINDGEFKVKKLERTDQELWGMVTYVIQPGEAY